MSASAETSVTPFVLLLQGEVGRLQGRQSLDEPTFEDALQAVAENRLNDRGATLVTCVKNETTDDN